MTISKDEVRKLAELSRIELTEEEIEKFAGQFEEILEFLNQINQVKVSEEVERDFQNLNTFRKDEAKESSNRDAILENMDLEDGYLKVKKILNND